VHLSDCEQRPLIRDPAELVGAAGRESDGGSDDEVLDGAGGEDLVGFRECRDPNRDVNRAAGDVIADQLELPGVDAGAGLDPAGCGGVPQGSGAADRLSRGIEGGEDTLAGAL
jgi:hypothetical protein